MKYLTVLSVLLLVVACTQSEQVKTDPSYSDDVQPIFTANCVGCHGSAAQNGNYRLDSRAGAMANGSDTVPNVIPGEPDSSKLYQNLDFGTMPPTGPLEGMKIQTVKNWITQGAKDN